MNIVGLPGAEMVNFMHPRDYLFSNPAKSPIVGSEQGGIYLRSYISIRIEVNIRMAHH
jgi:hypothetical protein